MDCHVLLSDLEVAAEATSFFQPYDIFTIDEKNNCSETLPKCFAFRLLGSEREHISEVKIMRKNLTEIVFILDRSGSMSGLEADTIGGYNSLLEKQKKEDGEAIVSTVLFDDTQEVLHDRVNLDKMKPITDKEYYVRGCTALLDAVGGAIFSGDLFNRCHSSYWKCSQVCQRRRQTGKDIIYHHNRWYGKFQS